MRLFIRSFAAAILLSISSCVKDKHQVRFENQFELQINNVKIGTDGFGNVAPGETTAYKVLPQGQLSISGQSNKGYITGTAHITGKGQHEWTVKLMADQSITLVKEK